MAKVPTETFQYEKLSGSEIRLLSIKPNNGSGALECRLQHYELEPDTTQFTLPSMTADSENPVKELFRKKPPKYHALSYAWGDKKDDKIPIIVNDKLLHITRNLHEGLFRIQKLLRSGNFRDFGSAGDPVLLDFSRRTRLIWVDAICINQEDMAEKSLQVPRMGDIYRQAADVIAWLGEPAEQDVPHIERWFKLVPILWTLDEVRLGEKDVASRLKFLHMIASPGRAERLERLVDALGQILPPPIHDAYLNGALEEVFVEENFEEALKAIGQGLKTVLENTWFSRIWTLQEALLARSSGLLSILIGEFWTDIRFVAIADKFLDALTEHESDKYWGPYMSALGLKNSYMTFDADASNDQDELSAAHTLNDMLRLTQKRSATIPHDHIYGFLGLMDSSKLPDELEPDYKLPFEQVWHQYITFLAEKTGDLNRLSCSGQGLNGVPSWVPDLRLPGKTLKSSLNDSFVSFSENGQKLHGVGIRLGTITETFTFNTKHLPDDGLAHSWPQTHVYEDCVEQLCTFRDTMLIPSCKLQNISAETMFTSLITDPADPDRYTSLDDLLTVHPQAGSSAIAANDENGNDSERQRRRDCVAMARHLSEQPYSLTDTGMLVCENHVHEAADPSVGDVICVLMGSNWPWRLRASAGDQVQHSFMCDWVDTVGKPRDAYNAEYFEDKDVEQFTVV